MSGTVHTTSEEFENGGFTLKKHQMFFVENTPEKFEKHINKRYLRKTGQGNQLIILWPPFSKTPFSGKMFSVHAKTQGRRFKFLQFKERFRKAPFC